MQNSNLQYYSPPGPNSGSHPPSLSQVKCLIYIYVYFVLFDVAFWGGGGESCLVVVILFPRPIYTFRSTKGNNAHTPPPRGPYPPTTLVPLDRIQPPFANAPLRHSIRSNRESQKCENPRKKMSVAPRASATTCNI